MTLRLTSLLPVGLALAATLAHGQTLGEAAERERQRKKAEKPKVFTDDDLAKGKPTPRPTPKDGKAPKVAASPLGATPAPEEPAAPETASEEPTWRTRAAAAATAVQSARGALQGAEERLEQAMSPFHPVYPRGFGSPEIPALQKAIADAKEKVAAAESASAELAAQARSAGVPSRWLDAP